MVNSSHRHDITSLDFTVTSTETHTTDALLKKVFTKTHTTDSLLKKTQTKTHTTDALLKKTLTESHTTDSLLKKTSTKTHTTNSLLKKALTKTHTTDSLLNKSLTKTHTTDSLLKKSQAKSHSSDSILKKTFTKTHTTDALAKKTQTKTHTTDALITRSCSFSFSSYTPTSYKTCTGQIHFTDSLLKKTQTLSNTADSLLKKTITLTHTTSALKKKTQTKVHTTDAMSASRVTKAHTADALFKKRQTLSHSTDSYLQHFTAPPSGGTVHAQATSVRKARKIKTAPLIYGAGRVPIRKLFYSNQVYSQLTLIDDERIKLISALQNVVVESVTKHRFALGKIKYRTKSKLSEVQEKQAQSKLSTPLELTAIRTGLSFENIKEMEGSLVDDIETGGTIARLNYINAESVAFVSELKINRVNLASRTIVAIVHSKMTVESIIINYESKIIDIGASGLCKSAVTDSVSNTANCELDAELRELLDIARALEELE